MYVPINADVLCTVAVVLSYVCSLFLGRRLYRSSVCGDDAFVPIVAFLLGPCSLAVAIIYFLVTCGHKKP